MIFHTERGIAADRLGQKECFIRSYSGETLPHFPDVDEGGKCPKNADAILKSAKEHQALTL